MKFLMFHDVCDLITIFFQKTKNIKILVIKIKITLHIFSISKDF